MLHNIKNRKKDQGFTIIEVLIVLAIAGLILLIVFLAVPALQRTSRNTNRKNDVSALAGAISEFESNNGGALLTLAQVTGSDTPANNGPAVANAKLGFYDYAKVFANNTGTPAAAVKSGTASSTVVTPDSIIVWIGYDCSNGTAVPPAAGSSRSVAIEYAVETSGTSGVQTECSAS